MKKITLIILATVLTISVYGQTGTFKLDTISKPIIGEMVDMKMDIKGVTIKRLINLMDAFRLTYPQDTTEYIVKKRYYYKSSTGTYIDNNGKLHIENAEQEIINLIYQLYLVHQKR